jgi:hypothetical protein
MARLMKYCPNYQCVAYGHVVYAQSTRCAFCRWDLKPPRMKSETMEEKSQTPVLDQTAIRPSPTEAHREDRRRPPHALRPTA